MRVLVGALLIGCTGLAAEEQPRVVSLAPHLTELAYAAGAGDALVGAVAYSDWPESAKKLPRIGDAYRFNMEAILGLDAELALAWRGGTPEAVVNRLRELDIEVLWIETRDLDDIGDALERIGRRLGSLEKATGAAATYRETLADIRERNTRVTDVSIFYQVSARPLFTLGGQHVITEVIETCGAENIFGDLEIEAASIDREAVIARSPDIIIAGRNESGGDPLEVWRGTRLVEQGKTRLESVDPERLVRPTPRIIEGIEFVCRLVDQRATQAGSTSG